MKKINKVSMFMAVFACMAFLISCSGGGNSPADTSKAFVKNIEKGNIDAAVRLFKAAETATPEEIEKMSSMLSEGTGQVESKGGVKKMEVLSETISEDGKKAEVELKIIYENGEEDVSITDLRKTDDGWKLVLEK